MPEENKKPRVRYAEKGGKFGGAVGAAGAAVYVLSHGWNLLTLNLIIIAAVVGLSLIGGGVGYAFGKWVESRDSNPC